jgi:aminoglycoside 6'-N-acetyltransferase
VTGQEVGIRGERTVVRAATEEEVTLLAAWHADPGVSRYWDGETFTADQLRARLARPLVDAFVVEVDGEPVGYLQAWWEEDEPLRGGLDMFLVPAARHHGLGPDAGRAVARHLRDVRGWAEITVDPYVWNDAAVRAWRKAGFVEVEKRPPDSGHTAPWLLMVWRP